MRKDMKECIYKVINIFKELSYLNLKSKYGEYFNGV